MAELLHRNHKSQCLNFVSGILSKQHSKCNCDNKRYNTSPTCQQNLLIRSFPFFSGFCNFVESFPFCKRNDFPIGLDIKLFLLLFNKYCHIHSRCPQNSPDDNSKITQEMSKTVLIKFDFLVYQKPFTYVFSG